MTQGNPNLEQLRRAESALVLAHLTPGMRVIELGGGNGLQAKMMEDFGCSVRSIDVPGRQPPPVQHFPVEDYDGVHIPGADASFDVVFSSSVLEHVRDLPALFAEMRRVLTPSGFMVHIVPGTVWRFWTSVARYRLLLGELLHPGPAPAVADPRSRLRRAASFTKALLIEPPHGEHANALVELYHFNRRVWMRVFEENGWVVSEAYGNGLFYTGCSTFPDLSLERRRRLSRLLGSSCQVFVLRPGSAPRR
ncbi:MAG: class I SAM-dependent methyltransferase [Minicystis sp.]